MEQWHQGIGMMISTYTTTTSTTTTSTTTTTSSPQIRKEDHRHIGWNEEEEEVEEDNPQVAVRPRSPVVILLVPWCWMMLLLLVVVGYFNDYNSAIFPYCNGLSLQPFSMRQRTRQQQRQPHQFQQRTVPHLFLMLSPKTSSSLSNLDQPPANTPNAFLARRPLYYKVAVNDTTTTTTAIVTTTMETTPKRIHYDDFTSLITSTNPSVTQDKKTSIHIDHRKESDHQDNNDADHTTTVPASSTRIHLNGEVDEKDKDDTTRMMTTTMMIRKDDPIHHHEKDVVVDHQDQIPLVSPATARWLLILSAALYGTNFAVVKSLVAVVPVGLLGTLRFFLAALVTLPWLWPTSRSSSKEDYWQSEEWSSTIAGLEVGLWTSIGYVAQAVGLGSTTLASTSAFVCSLAVVVVPVLDWLVNKKPLARREQFYGIVMALIGVALLELGDIESFGGLSNGDMLSMIQPVAFGIGFLRMERAMRKFPTQAKRTTAGQLLAVFLASISFMTIHPDLNVELSQIQPILEDPMIWAGLIWTGIVTTALTVYMETVALQTLSAAETTLIFSTEPLWGALTAALLLGESFGPKAMVGGGLIIAACLVSSLGMDGLQDLLKRQTVFQQQQQDDDE